MTTQQFEFIDYCLCTIRRFRLSDDVALFISSQFALESNFGQSNKAINYFNLAGMRYPLVRLSTAVGKDSDGFATYNSFVDSIFDYFLCLQYHKPYSDVWQDLEKFKRFMPWYCPERDYIDKITKIFNQLKSQNHE